MDYPNNLCCVNCGRVMVVPYECLQCKISKLCPTCFARYDSYNMGVCRPCYIKLKILGLQRIRIVKD